VSRAVTAAQPAALIAVSSSAVSASDSVPNTPTARRDNHTVNAMAGAVATIAAVATTRRLRTGPPAAGTMAFSFVCLGLPVVVTVDLDTEVVKVPGKRCG
jgi:hypothetical protein